MLSKHLVFKTKFLIGLELISLDTTNTVLKIPKSGSFNKCFLGIYNAFVFWKISNHTDKYFDFIIGMNWPKPICSL